jgi:hypothetical protein
MLSDNGRATGRTPAIAFMLLNPQLQKHEKSDKNKTTKQAAWCRALTRGFQSITLYILIKPRKSRTTFRTR